MWWFIQAVSFIALSAVTLSGWLLLVTATKPAVTSRDMLIAIAVFLGASTNLMVFRWYLRLWPWHDRTEHKHGP